MTVDWIRKHLGLEPHGTCGYMHETFVSQVQVPATALPAAYHGSRPMGGVFYFLVTPEAGVRLHRIRSDQMYHHYLGDPLDVLLLHAGGQAEVHTMGPDLAAGMRPQLLIPGNAFHAAKVAPGIGYSLLGTSVWARADPSDVEIGDVKQLLALFPSARADIEAASPNDIETMKLTLKPATEADVEEILALRAAVAVSQTAKFGKGPWSSFGTERGVRFTMARATIYLARRRRRLIAMLTLSTRKPWAIDATYFTPCTKPLYLTDMAVDPDIQGQGVGKLCLVDARRVACLWPSPTIRLDAYDLKAGAGEFYRKCGFREVGRAVYRKTPLIYLELLV